MIVFRFAVFAITTILLLRVSVSFGQEINSYGIDHLFTTEQFSDAAVSPDGEWLAIVIRRAATENEVYRWRFLRGDNHSDIWLLAADGGIPRNLTNGSEDASGYWNPVWSPNGKYLAMLSTHGGDSIRVFIWERDSDTIRQLDERTVDLEMYTQPGRRFDYHPLRWISDTELLTALLPSGEWPISFDIQMEGTRIATRQWEKVKDGRKSTVSVLESGLSMEKRRPLSKLVVIDVAERTYINLAEGKFRHILLSPDGRFIAAIEDIGPIQPEAGRRLRWNDVHTRLWIGSYRENGLNVVEHVLDPVVGFGVVPHRWSPDGTTLAVLARRNQSDEQATTAFAVTANGEIIASTDNDIQVSGVAWTRDGILLASGQLAENPDREQTDWWLLEEVNGRYSATIVTAELSNIPTQVYPSSVPDEVVGLTDGEIVALNVRDASTRIITAGIETRIRSILWPNTEVLSIGTETIVVATGRSCDRNVYLIHLTDVDTEVEPLHLPTPRAILADYMPDRRFAVFYSAENDGSFLWSGDPLKTLHQRMTLNEHLSGVVAGRRKLIEYRGLEGDSLSALLVLPVGYEEGTSYPTVTWVYPGYVMADTSYILAEKNMSLPLTLNLQILAGQGYLVLIPSIPISRGPSDPFLELLRGVIPAVDRTIELGIADPRRLAVMGHSYGGYGTFGLVTLTNRFHAAIALAGTANLTSSYGTFDPRFRYTDYAYENMFGPIHTESGQGRMGGAPWADLWRYLRNSPYFFVDRVQTPIMFIHGDQDYVPIQQAEEFFVALYRLGKRARFVRYWGEGHVLQSPANIRDMWGQILKWLDENLPCEALDKTTDG